jgi:hypothetical protein
MRLSVSRWIPGSILLFIILLAGFGVAQAQPGTAPFADILTSTPMADGAIVHIVQQDETLATISSAYGISMADLRSMNAMAPTSNLIYPGQKLIIRLPQPATATPTNTATVPRPTRTPTVVTPTRTPRPTGTATITPTPTATPNPVKAAFNGFMDQNRSNLLIAMIAFCALGLGFTLWRGFRKSS